jgi:hypothetical protein
MIAATSTLPGAAATLVVSMHSTADVNLVPTVQQATATRPTRTTNTKAMEEDIMAIKGAITATTAEIRSG